MAIQRGGLGVAAAYAFPEVLADGQGGAFALWYTNREAFALQLQRVSASGALAEGWPSAGLLLDSGNWSRVLYDGRNHPVVVPDDAGGVFVAWTHESDSSLPAARGTHLLLQRIRGDGTLAGGWSATGVVITPRPGPNRPAVVEDGVGGVFLAWTDLGDYNIWVQHLGPDGQPRSGWNPGGKVLADTRAIQIGPMLTPEGAAV